MKIDIVSGRAAGDYAIRAGPSLPVECPVITTDGGVRSKYHLTRIGARPVTCRAMARCGRSLDGDHGSTAICGAEIRAAVTAGCYPVSSTATHRRGVDLPGFVAKSVVGICPT